MTWPKVKVEAAFGDGPFAATKTWTDISDRVLAVTAKHGRDQELGKFQTGNLGVRLSNDDRAFDPSHASGSYFGDLVPMVPMRSYFRWDVVPPAALTPTLDQAIAWWDARDYDDSGTLVDLSGNGNDGPVSVQAGRFIGTRSHPDDGMGPVRLYTAKSDRTAYLEADPVTFTDGMFIAVRAKSIGDPTSTGAFTDAARVVQDTEGDLSNGFTLAQVIATGAIRVRWATASGYVTADLGAGETDVDDLYDFAGSFVAATGVFTVYVRDDANPDETVDGRGWRIVGTSTVGAQTVGTSDGPLALGVGKGLCDYAYVGDWDGTTATELAVWDAAEVTQTPVIVGSAVTTGATEWTVVGEAQVVSDRVRIVMDSDPGTRMVEVPDDAILDQAGDFSFVIADAPTVTGNPFDTHAAKFSGSLGVNAVGWVLADGSGAGGSGVILESGGAPFVATAAGLVVEDLVLGYTVDRTADVATVYLNGAVHDTVDISALGSMSNAETLKLISGIGASFYGAALFDQALTAAEHAAVVEEWDVTRPIGYGYVDGWPQEYSPPSVAEVQVDCPDVFAVLANAPLEGGSPLTALIAADQPTHWYPLGDAEGASFFTDLGSAAIDGAATGSVVPGFGAAGLDAGDPEATSWGTDRTSDGGLDTRVQFLGSEWDTVAFLLAMDDPVTGQPLTVARGSDWWIFVMPADGKVVFSLAADGTARDQTTVSVADSAPHLVVARRVSSGVWTIYVDGVLSGENFPPSGTTGAAGYTMRLGIADGFGFGAFSYPFDGSLQHVAFFTTDVTTKAAAYYQAFLGWDEDRTGERVSNILDAIGHPTAERDIDTGTITVGPAEWSESARALGELQAVEATEQGKLYQDAAGTVLFRERHAWVTATRSATSQYTFSDDPAEPLHYERGITLDTGVAQIINVVTVSWSGGTVVVKDQTSIDAYGPRDHPVTTSAPSATVARSVGEYLIDRYKDPILRVDKITLNPAATTGDGALWGPAADLRVGDRVTVERHPQGVGTAIVQESIVEAKTWTLDDGRNRALCTLTLSPADTRSYFIVGVSEVGGTDVIG